MNFEEWAKAHLGEPPHSRIHKQIWNAATAAQREPMVCGHPRACVVVGTERRDGEYEQHCGWCAEVGILQEQLAKLAMVMEKEPDV